MISSGLLWVPPGSAEVCPASHLPGQQLRKASSGVIKLLSQCTLLMSKTITFGFIPAVWAQAAARTKSRTKKHCWCLAGCSFLVAHARQVIGLGQVEDVRTA